MSVYCRISVGCKVAAAALLVGALLVSGCGGYGYGFTDGSQQFARMYAGPIPLTMVNDLGRTACYIRISPSPASTMGDDWLGASETVEPGMSRTFNVATRGAWDIRIESCRHEPLAEQQSVSITSPVRMMMSTLRPVPDWGSSGGETVIVAPARAPVVTLPNVVVHA